MLVSYPVRGGKPVVEALKVGLFPRAAPRDTQDVGSPGWSRTPPSPMRPRAGCGGTEMRQ